MINNIYDYGKKFYVPFADPVSYNGKLFQAVPGAKYLHDYVALAESINNNPDIELGSYRKLILTDLWFVVYFILGVSCANHPFWVNACREIQTGPETNTLDLWSRDHGKTSCITIAETMQDILKSHAEDGKKTEDRIVILSYTRSLARSMVKVIKEMFETSVALKACFPDVLYQDPEKESPKWSELEGLRVKRRGYYKEETLEPWGLVDGMPTGRHFTKRVYDDIVTLDLVKTPEMMEAVKMSFDLSSNLGTMSGRCRVIGTYYHHDDPLVYIAAKKRQDGTPMFTKRLKPATHDGTFSGDLVYYTQEKWEELMSGNHYHIGTQQLLDPTPLGTNELRKEWLKTAPVELIPSDLYKFMLIDSAGTAGNRTDGRRADCWAIHLVGVDPYRDDMGASNVYLLDTIIEPLSHDEAMDCIVNMYCRSGRIRAVCVEKVGAMSMEIHVTNALRAKGKFISIDSNTLIILNPSGRKKAHRVAGALSYPLRNGKIYLSESLPRAYAERINMEMDKFPQSSYDALDALSYIYDILKDYKFPRREDDEEPKKEPWWKRRKETQQVNWRTA